jgi:hypothetical protein
MEAKPYLKCEIADMYGVTKPTLMAWIFKTVGKERLCELGYEKNQKMFSTLQVEEIFTKLGKPCKTKR